ncbi:MAG: tRNA (adenosine(37)-N6)-threonylcarbamoyltransferase complex dimerization subunit type 1 TsaB, partial [Ruminococcus sp.]
MKILGIDTSAKTSSVGICEDNRIVDELFLDKGLTHSETILPMIDEILTRNELSLDDIDALSVNNGPGSFTGIRIGVAVVKGLAFDKDIPCYEVSTLDSIAYNCKDKNGLVVATMDARRNQVYNANYIVSGGKIEKVKNDRSILIKDLYLEISEYDGDVYIIGDGQD